MNELLHTFFVKKGFWSIAQTIIAMYKRQWGNSGYFNTTILLFLAAILSIAASCSKSEEDNSYQETDIQFEEGIGFTSDVVKIVGKHSEEITPIVLEDGKLSVSKAFIEYYSIEVGRIVLYKPNESAKDAFVGRVVAIESDGANQYIVTTEVPSIEDVFTELKTSINANKDNTIAEHFPDETDNVVFNGIVDDSVWESLDTIYYKPSYISTKAEDDDTGSSIPINITLSFTAKANNAFQGIIYLKLEGSAGFNSISSLWIDVDAIIGLKGDFNMTAYGGDKPHREPLLKLKRPVRLYSNGILSLAFAPSLDFYWMGGLKIQAGFKYEILHNQIALTYEGGEMKSATNGRIKDAYFRVFNINASGEFGLALDGDLFMFLLVENLGKAGANFLAGVSIAGEKNVGIQWPDIASFDCEVRFSPFLEFVPYLALKKGGRLEKNEFASVKLSSDSFTLPLLPDIHDINYQKRSENLTVNATRAKEDMPSFMETEDDGIALFKKGAQEPESWRSMPAPTKASGSADMTFSLQGGVEYEIARYAKSKDGTYSYDERIPIESDIREYLVRFYQMTDGDNWRINTNWCSDMSVTDWYGVSYNDVEKTYSLEIPENNIIGDLDFSGCSELGKLDIRGNKLTNFDVSGCSNLKKADVMSSSIVRFNAKDCLALTDLCLWFNELEVLSISGCTNLKSVSFFPYSTALGDVLYIGNQNLKYVDASMCSSLSSTDTDFSSFNQLETVRLRGCSSLKFLRVPNNKLTSLDVSGCSDLRSLDASNNELTSLDVSGCSSLDDLNVSNNKLTSLDVSGCSSLYDLNVSNNKLTGLDVSGCSFLYDLDASNNELTGLDVSGFSILYDLDVSNNELTSLDVSGCSSLEHLDVSNNELTNLDVSRTILHGDVTQFKAREIRYNKSKVWLKNNPKYSDNKYLYTEKWYDSYTYGLYDPNEYNFGYSHNCFNYHGGFGPEAIYRQ